MKRNSFKGVLILLFGVVVLGLLIGCDAVLGAEDDPPGVKYDTLADEINLSQHSRLSAFDSEVLQSYDGLQALADDLDSMAISFATQVIQSDEFPFTYYEYDGMAETDAGANGSAGSSGSYETNNQVSGVEEVDILQSNGTYSFVAAGGDLLSFNAEGELLDRLTLFGDKRIAGLLLFENRLLAIEQKSYGYWFLGYHGTGFEDKPTTELALLDIGSQGELSIAAEESLKGSYMSARMADGQVYLTSSQDFELRFWLRGITEDINRNPLLTASQKKKRALKLLKTEVPKWRNKLIAALYEKEGELDQSAIANTLRMYDLADGAEDEDVLPFSTSYDSFLNLYSFDIRFNFTDLSRQGSFSTGNHWRSTMYSDGEYVVLANEGWTISDAEWEENVFLTVYQNQGGEMRPIALGEAQGHTLNQFSLDIYQDNLRIATTLWARWNWDDENGWHQETESESLVTILDIHSSGPFMNQIGYLDNLGLGERLFAVRFMQDRGFLVTFEMIDPFYTLDLSVPSDPRVVGELKIPGFSRYLHPISENHILAIGQDNGVQVALFDVTNMAAPIQAHKFVFSEYSYSAAEFNHHAFRYVDSEEILIIPQDAWWRYGDEDRRIGFSILNVSPEQGIDERGFIHHPEYSWDETIINSPRSMLIEDSLITLMNSKIQSHDVADLSAQWHIDLE